MLEQLKLKFKEEVYELLDKLETSLLELEKKSNKQNLIKEIFRIMHTIKGAAGMYEFHKTVKLTHELESIYAFIRDKNTGISKNIISLTFDAIDYIRKLVASDDKKINLDAYNKFIKRIEELANKLNKKLDTINQNKVNDETNEIDDDEDLIDFFADENEIEIEVSEATYRIIFQPEANLEERNVNLNAIIEEVKNFNDSVLTFDHSQSKENILNNKFYIFWEFFIVTDQPEEEISDIFIFVDDTIEITKLCNTNLLNKKIFTDYLNENYQSTTVFDLKELQKIGESLTTEDDLLPIVEKTNLSQEEPIIKETSSEDRQNNIIEQQTIISTQKTICILF